MHGWMNWLDEDDMSLKEKREKLILGERCVILIALLIVFVSAMERLCIPCSAQTEVYRSVNTEKKQIALSFDDGPHPILTERILDILERYHAKATFFMVGVNVVNYPDAAHAVLKRGHEIGNHTFSHVRLSAMNESEVNREIFDCEDALEELLEYRPRLFRPPQGFINRHVEKCVEEGDYGLVLWSIDTRDWENKNAAQIAKNVIENAKPGDIILMHDYIGKQSKTPEALEIILPALIEKGYEFVTVSNMLGIQ